MPFLLRLFAGREWEMVAGQPEVEPFLRKLASIMRLKTTQASDNRAKVYIFPKDGDKDFPPLQDIPEMTQTGWQVRDFKNLKLWQHPQNSHLVVKVDINNKDHNMNIICMWYLLYFVHELAITLEGMPFHSGLVVKEGSAYLLSAPGNTGKSTCCRRIPHPWEAISDDEAIIFKSAGRYFVHPFPTWSNYLWKNDGQKNWPVEQFYSLKGIFFLEQAENDAAEVMKKNVAAVSIYDAGFQMFRRSLRAYSESEETQTKLKIFDNACHLARNIPCYKLKISLTGRFWEQMERVIGQ
ncbi:SynChlorMet cassette protein ScmC [Candidatus Saganbacteria bacterium]|nr:SynChlorMet cassette protein ScmC [Candidatus Saganbacteria bacterium]